MPISYLALQQAAGPPGSDGAVEGSTISRSALAALARALAALARALPSLVVRDGDRPVTWGSSAFVGEVAEVRSVLSAARDLPTLARLAGGLIARPGADDRRGGISLQPWDVAPPVKPNPSPDAVAWVDGPDAQAFEWASRLLATNPAIVAVAIRWREIHANIQLEPWPELLRRHSMAGRPLDADLDRTIWFG